MIEQPAIDETGKIVRGNAPVSAVSVPNHLGLSTSLVHALDYVVMLHLLFATAAGRAVTPMQVWRELQARGIRSVKNSNELVGKNAVYESFARLITAGFLRKQELPNERFPGRKGPIRYEVYDNPAWNPDWQATQARTEPLEPAVQHEHAQAEPQVGTLPGTPEPSSREADKTAGQNASRNAGTGVQGTGVPGSINRRVPAGQNASAVPGSINASPPHPPVGGGNTTPSPQKPGRVPKATKWAAACALDPDDYMPTAEEITAAREFLQQLPGKWEMGVDEARDLAPLLASRAHTQGYELDTILELRLTQDDPKDPARTPARVMPIRIRGLKRFRTEDTPAAAQSSGGLAPWCTKCNKGEEPREPYQRTVELPDGRDVPCKECHPKYVRAGV